MQYFIYNILRIYDSLGIFAYPLIVLQFISLIKMIILIKKHRPLKTENETDKKETALLICYCILTAILWFPLIIISLGAVIKFRTR